MYEYNCCTNLEETVEWFRSLKKDGVSKDDILDILEFDSDQYPDPQILEKAREIVYSEKSER